MTTVSSMGGPCFCGQGRGLSQNSLRSSSIAGVPRGFLSVPAHKTPVSPEPGPEPGPQDPYPITDRRLGPGFPVKQPVLGCLRPLAQCLLRHGRPGASMTWEKGHCCRPQPEPPAHKSSLCPTQAGIKHLQAQTEPHPSGAAAAGRAPGAAGGDWAGERLKCGRGRGFQRPRQQARGGPSQAPGTPTPQPWSSRPHITGTGQESSAGGFSQGEGVQEPRGEGSRAVSRLLSPRVGDCGSDWGEHGTAPRLT